MSLPISDQFGLIIIGSEILDGRRQDAHFAFFRDRLLERHIHMRYSLLLEDDPELLIAKLEWAMDQPHPFFCCGGIGGTPDDHTRQCAAKAGGVGIAVHPEGAGILHERMGRDLTPSRLRMVTFPETSTLIPNPVNQVPGFTFRNGHFLPGFPEMAHPMMVWVLDHCYSPAREKVCHVLRLPGAREADLADVMEQFTDDHPQLSFSSLPRFTDTGSEIDLSVKGPTDEARAGLERLVAMLDVQGVEFTVVT